ncbi:hypothetical protein H310_01143 [Aphanomyces invadans]|uniref:Uncharacterized protein n=1 Tax=Aphanomyces invadans TaxID=157072 RepID=A0A024UQL8_9STRA|nr:hypothetical protein H310_01143 [Aphanomyces invadans]ETW08599.1 hypothetical protein H310_01143 [Aphanomyces invadans]|eukprot:XP_008862404.1 hypothetical protein H310_01143 [Aphanomyces invadans]
MLARVIRRVVPRAVRPAVATNVEFDNTTPRFLQLPLLPAKIPLLPRVLQRLSFLDPFLRLNVLRSQLKYALSVLDVPLPNETSNRSSPIAFDLQALLAERPQLPGNELQQEYEFDRRPAVEEVAIARYVALGQHLYQSMMWTTHPLAWHAVGQRCA